jgi:cell division septation protein DedD
MSNLPRERQLHLRGRHSGTIAGVSITAKALQQKKFPAFVITPSTDKYYRVHVGPYADPESATIARHGLEANGFKSIVQR